jgi:hypothetical protein
MTRAPARAPTDRPMTGVGFEITYGYLADLCSALEWSLALERLDDDRFALRVYLGRCRSGQLLAGAKFTREASLDAAAEVVFDVLRANGLV